MVVEGLCDFIWQDFPEKVTTLSKFGSHRSCNSRDIKNAISYMILQNVVIEGPYDLIIKSSSLPIAILSSLAGIGIGVIDM